MSSSSYLGKRGREEKESKESSGSSSSIFVDAATTPEQLLKTYQDLLPSIIGQNTSYEIAKSRLYNTWTMNDIDDAQKAAAFYYFVRNMKLTTLSGLNVESKDKMKDLLRLFNNECAITKSKGKQFFQDLESFKVESDNNSENVGVSLASRLVCGKSDSGSMTVDSFQTIMSEKFNEQEKYRFFKVIWFIKKIYFELLIRKICHVIIRQSENNQVDEYVLKFLSVINRELEYTIQHALMCTSSLLMNNFDGFKKIFKTKEDSLKRKIVRESWKYFEMNSGCLDLKSLNSFLEERYKLIEKIISSNENIRNVLFGSEINDFIKKSQSYDPVLQPDASWFERIKRATLTRGYEIGSWVSSNTTLTGTLKFISANAFSTFVNMTFPLNIVFGFLQLSVPFISAYRIGAFEALQKKFSILDKVGPAFASLRNSGISISKCIQFMTSIYDGSYTSFMKGVLFFVIVIVILGIILIPHKNLNLINEKKKELESLKRQRESLQKDTPLKPGAGGAAASGSREEKDLKIKDLDQRIRVIEKIKIPSLEKNSGIIDKIYQKIDNIPGMNYIRELLQVKLEKIPIFKFLKVILTTTSIFALVLDAVHYFTENNTELAQESIMKAIQLTKNEVNSQQAGGETGEGETGEDDTGVKRTRFEEKPATNEPGVENNFFSWMSSNISAGLEAVASRVSAGVEAVASGFSEGVKTVASEVSEAVEAVANLESIKALLEPVINFINMVNNTINVLLKTADWAFFFYESVVQVLVVVLALKSLYFSITSIKSLFSKQATHVDSLSTMNIFKKYEIPGQVSNVFTDSVIYDKSLKNVVFQNCGGVKGLTAYLDTITTYSEVKENTLYRWEQNMFAQFRDYISEQEIQIRIGNKKIKSRPFFYAYPKNTRDQVLNVVGGTDFLKTDYEKMMVEFNNNEMFRREFKNKEEFQNMLKSNDGLKRVKQIFENTKRAETILNQKVISDLLSNSSLRADEFERNPEFKIAFKDEATFQNIFFSENGTEKVKKILNFLLSRKSNVSQIQENVKRILSTKTVLDTLKNVDERRREFSNPNSDFTIAFKNEDTLQKISNSMNGQEKVMKILEFLNQIKNFTRFDKGINNDYYILNEIAPNIVFGEKLIPFIEKNVKRIIEENTTTREDITHPLIDDIIKRGKEFSSNKDFKVAFQNEQKFQDILRSENGRQKVIKILIYLDYIKQSTRNVEEVVNKIISEYSSSSTNVVGDSLPMSLNSYNLETLNVKNANESYEWIQNDFALSLFGYDNIRDGTSNLTEIKSKALLFEPILREKDSLEYDFFGPGSKIETGDVLKKLQDLASAILYNNQMRSNLFKTNKQFKSVFKNEENFQQNFPPGPTRQERIVRILRTFDWQEMSLPSSSETNFKNEICKFMGWDCNGGRENLLPAKYKIGYFLKNALVEKDNEIKAMMIAGFSYLINDNYLKEVISQIKNVVNIERLQGMLIDNQVIASRYSFMTENEKYKKAKENIRKINDSISLINNLFHSFTTENDKTEVQLLSFIIQVAGLGYQVENIEGTFLNNSLQQKIKVFNLLNLLLKLKSKINKYFNEDVLELESSSSIDEEYKLIYETSIGKNIRLENVKYPVLCSIFDNNNLFPVFFRYCNFKESGQICKSLLQENVLKEIKKETGFDKFSRRFDKCLQKFFKLIHMYQLISNLEGKKNITFPLNVDINKDILRLVKPIQDYPTETTRVTIRGPSEFNILLINDKSTTPTLTTLYFKYEKILKKIYPMPRENPNLFKNCGFALVGQDCSSLECSVCLRLITENCTELPCGHKFHNHCASEIECPYCKSKFSDKIDYNVDLFGIYLKRFNNVLKRMPSNYLFTDENRFISIGTNLMKYEHQFDIQYTEDTVEKNKMYDFILKKIENCPSEREKEKADKEKEQKQKYEEEELLRMISEPEIVRPRVTVTPRQTRSQTRNAQGFAFC